MEKDSPASSTPGFWTRNSEESPKEIPGVPSPVMSSELTEGDQSTILDSSAAGDCSTTVQWEPSMEDPTILNDPNSESPIASRTRSHDGSLASATSFMIGLLAKELKEDVALDEQQKELGAYTIVSEDGSYSMTTEDIETIEGGLNASKYQPGYETDIEQSKSLLKCLTNLEKAKNTLDDILNDEETENNIQAYRDMNNTRNKRTEEIELTEKYKEENTEDEEVLGVTFIRKTAEITRNLDNTITALRSVQDVNLQKLPLEVLEKLIKLLINHCIECQERIQKDGSLLEQLDGDLFGLAGTHEKLRAVHNYCLELLKDLKESKEKNESLTAELNKVKEERQLEETPEVAETRYLKKDLKELKNRNDGFIIKLGTMKAILERKTLQGENQEKRITELERKLETERQRERKNPKCTASRKRQQA